MSVPFSYACLWDNNVSLAAEQILDRTLQVLSSRERSWKSSSALLFIPYFCLFVLHPKFPRAFLCLTVVLAPLRSKSKIGFLLKLGRGAQKSHCACLPACLLALGRWVGEILFFVLDSFRMRICVGGFRVWFFQAGSGIWVPWGGAEWGPTGYKRPLVGCYLQPYPRSAPPNIRFSWHRKIPTRSPDIFPRLVNSPWGFSFSFPFHLEKPARSCCPVSVA